MKKLNELNSQNQELNIANDVVKDNKDSLTKVTSVKKVAVKKVADKNVSDKKVSDKKAVNSKVGVKKEKEVNGTSLQNTNKSIVKETLILQDKETQNNKDSLINKDNKDTVIENKDNELNNVENLEIKIKDIKNEDIKFEEIKNKDTKIQDLVNKDIQNKKSVEVVACQDSSISSQDGVVAVKKDTKKSVLEICKITAILFLIACIAGGLLGVVNHFTQIDPLEVMNEKLKEFYDSEDGFNFVQVDKLDSSSIDKTILDKGKTLNVFNPKNTNKLIFMCEGFEAYKSSLKILVLIEDNKIIKIAKYESKETPGLGTKAFEQSYLSQFVGVSIADFESFTLDKKEGSKNVSAVSGATCTSRAVINAINSSVAYYKAFSQSILKGGLYV